MPLARPTLAELQTRSLADIQTRIPSAAPVLRRGVLGPIATAWANALHGLYGFVGYLGKQIVPWTAEGAFLEGWASLWGVTRKQPTFALGPITFTGENGRVIAAGSSLQSSTGVEFTTDADATIASGTAIATVTAVSAGKDANVAAAGKLTFISPQTGVNAQATVNAGGLTGGADLEDDAGLRARMLLRIQNPPHGGNKADYEFWALSVGPITRAWCFPAYDGPGTVRVYVANDSSTDPTYVADAADVTAVTNYIEPIKPVGVCKLSGGLPVTGLEVVRPQRHAVNVTASIVPNTAAVKAAAEATLAAMVLRDAVPEGKILLSRIREAISAASGETDSAVTVPAADVTAPSGKICVLGTVTWS